MFQLTTWFDELKVELSSSEIADCVETAEQLIGQLEQQKEATTDACVNTITEGESILDQIRYAVSYAPHSHDQIVNPFLLVSSPPLWDGVV